MRFADFTRHRGSSGVLFRCQSVRGDQRLLQSRCVVNGADNFATRYLVNDAAYMAGVKLVDGSIFLFEGQVTTFIPGQGCYRCLYPSPPPPGMVPSCAEAGVLGALPGTVGGIQATEVLKLLLDIGEPLVNRLLLYDALAMNDSAVEAMGVDELKVIAAELVTKVRQSVTIDWTMRESARARIRVMVRRILRKFGYPPDLQEAATKVVLEQAEALCSGWAP